MDDIEKFYDDWINHENYWFSPTEEDDIYLRDTYTHILEYYYVPGKFLRKDIIYVIIYDQLVRHIYRNQYGNHIITYYQQKALDIWNFIKTINLDILTTKDWCFMMLLLRHTNDQDHIFYVMYESWKKIQNTDEYNNISLLKRFIRATYDRCPKNFISLIDENIDTSIECCYAKYFRILDFVPEKDPTLDSYDDEYNKICNPIISSNQTILISLSGGVDSMVLAFIYASLQKKYDIKVVAVHINYMNRDSSYDEERFVLDWCSFLGIHCYVRRIQEVVRKICMDYELRDMYEDYTRDVRYSVYKLVWTKSLQLEGDPIVLLGHNKDDCFENIMTNLANKNKYDNLFGMDLEQVQDGIHFIRPFLTVLKSDLIEFSRKHNIPHLVDSTPKWSMRGKIRDIIVPSIQEWDSRFISSAFDLRDTLCELHNILYIYVDEFLILKADNDKLVYPIQKLHSSKIVWKNILNKLDMYPSNKSLKMLESRIEFFKKKFNGFSINHRITININKVSKIYLRKINQTSIEIFFDSN